LINFPHFVVETVQIIPFDKPVVPFTQQLLRYLGVPREGVYVGTFV